MRAIVQRVSEARVSTEGRMLGEIKQGIVVLLGVGNEDNEQDAAYLAEKIIHLRIFDDANGKMNISLQDVAGEMLVVSQFTLYGDCRKGKRPGYDRAARPEKAVLLYRQFIDICRESGIRVETGEFQAMMNVEIHNDGPVTLLLDSRKEF